MSASVVSPYMFQSYTWPSSGDVPCTVLLSALLLHHNFTWVCGRTFYPCCCHVPYLLSVLLSCVPLCCWSCRTVRKKTDSREVHMTTIQIEDTATYPSKIVTKQQGGKQHCTRNIPWSWSSIWPKHVGWHNRRRHSNVLRSDCVLVCILKHSACVGFLNNVRLCRLKYVMKISVLSFAWLQNVDAWKWSRNGWGGIRKTNAISGS